MAAPTWPATGQHVTTTISSEPEQHLCVVDDVRPPGCLVLRQPVSLTAAAPIGAPLVLRWTTAAGRHELTGRMGRPLWDRMPLWEVDVLRDPTVLQRRAFARVPDVLPVGLGQAGHRWDALAVDLSEGGARCSVRRDGTLLVVGGAELHLSLEGRPLVLQAEVLSLEAEALDRQVARVRFSAPGWVGGALRRRVMEQQRRARAASRR